RGGGAHVLLERPQPAREPRTQRPASSGPDQAPSDRGGAGPAQARGSGRPAARPDRRGLARDGGGERGGVPHGAARLCERGRALRPAGLRRLDGRGRHPRRRHRRGPAPGRRGRRGRRGRARPGSGRGRGDREAAPQGAGEGRPGSGESGLRAARDGRGPDPRQGGGRPPQALGSSRPGDRPTVRPPPGGAMPEPTTALERAIRSQPDELERLTEVDLGRPIELLEAARRVWLVGTGTSQHAAELGAAMLHEAGRDAVAVPSMHFVTWPRPLDRHDAVVLISHNAGAETAYAAAAHARATRAGLAVLPITRVGGGLPNALETVAQERSHTYTVSYTAVLLLLARIAGALGARTLDPETIRAVPEAVRRALENPGVEAIGQPDRLLVVFGSGPASVTAREGALKLREAARLPAEGYDAE